MRVDTEFQPLSPRSGHPRRYKFYGSAQTSQSAEHEPLAVATTNEKVKNVAPPKITVPVAPPPAADHLFCRWSYRFTK